jgi:hypothetical protein
MMRAGVSPDTNFKHRAAAPVPPSPGCAAQLEQSSSTQTPASVCIPRQKRPVKLEKLSAVDDDLGFHTDNDT